MDKVFIFCPISKLGKFVKVHFQKIYFCHCSKAVTLALMMLWEGVGGLVRNCDQFQLVDSLRPNLQMMPRMVMNVRWGGAGNYLDAGEINNLEVATLMNQWWSRPNDQLLNSCQDQEKRSQMFRIFLIPQYMKWNLIFVEKSWISQFLKLLNEKLFTTQAKGGVSAFENSTSRPSQSESAETMTVEK